MTRHGHPGCLNLAGGYPGRLLRLHAIFSEANLISSAGLSATATALFLSVFDPFGHQHGRILLTALTASAATFA
jgi:hypothetical protein